MDAAHKKISFLQSLEMQTLGHFGHELSSLKQVESNY